MGILFKIGKKLALRKLYRSATATNPTAQVLLGAAGMAITAGAVYVAQKRKKAIRNKVVVITGGSRGLGLALAQRFARGGASLVLAARDADELLRARQMLLDRAAVKYAEDVLLVPCDLTDEKAAADLIQRATTHFGRVDVLINNAGIIQVGPIEDQPISAFDEAMRVNFFSALNTIHAVLPQMLVRGSGSIVNIASIGGKLAMPHMLPYTASKFALTGFSEGLRSELKSKKIFVTTVCPGLLRTGSHVQAQFRGDAAKEYQWFAAAATTPGLSASTKRAANRIFHAVAARKAELTITPQAWLAARIHGMAPETTQAVAGILNDWFLPRAPQAESTAASVKGRELPQPEIKPLAAWNERLQRENNQQTG
ncbi:SDR family NAD(P)-dependent oxidoreductase [Terriglobus tenax]|uniref:SDR family NAD(P)-dependent oxidoreductase n=1 Tax=Terriglobus tenax TaxID=1111115 RepID=UPI0021DF846A|nr:SDR family NAD(P)-dependent oxidoreductase [Terriglobus tenax]